MLPSACERIYRAEPFRIQFHARVLSTSPGPDGTTRVELDRTAFYPTGGGQPFDTGSIAGWQVVDVQEAGEGRIAHLLRARLEEAPPPGTEVEGILDWDRRFDHMQQHTGQHILSRAFERAANAATRSFHLGERVCTIDLDLPAPTDEI